jgi:hypothetical protein
VQTRVTGMEGPSGVVVDLSSAPMIPPVIIDPSSLGAYTSSPLTGAWVQLYLTYPNADADETRWSVWAPGPTSTIVLPQLPPALASLAPADASTPVQWRLSTGEFVDGVDYATFVHAPLARVAMHWSRAEAGVAGTVR